MLEAIQSQWAAILNSMKEEYEISKVCFETWLLPLEVVSANNNVLTILAPENSALKIVSQKYSLMLQVVIV